MDEPNAETANEQLEVSKVFESLPSYYQTGKVGERTVYHFSIDGEDWTVTLRPDGCEVSKGKTGEDANCFLKTSKEIFLGTVRGDYTPTMTDLVTGKVKTNNPILIQTFLSAFRRS